MEFDKYNNHKCCIERLQDYRLKEHMIYAKTNKSSIAKLTVIQTP